MGSHRVRKRSSLLRKVLKGNYLKSKEEGVLEPVHVQANERVNPSSKSKHLKRKAEEVFQPYQAHVNEAVNPSPEKKGTLKKQPSKEKMEPRARAGKNRGQQNFSDQDRVYYFSSICPIADNI